MGTTFSRLQIINAALLSQGQTELAAEDDGSLEWRTLAANWVQVVESELQDGEYAHSIVEIELPSRLAAGKFGYADQYRVPSTVLHVRGAFTEDASGNQIQIADWYQGWETINVNSASGIWIDAVEDLQEDQFSPLFVMGIQLKMEAIILRAIKEEVSQAREMEQMAEEKLQRARTSSSKSKSPRPFFNPSSRFTRARFSRG
jgi:hypothetical protein